MKASRHNLSAASLILFLVAGMFSIAPVRGQDVAAYSVFKSQHFVQSSDSPPALRTADPFLVEALVDGSGSGEITEVNLTRPGSVAAEPLPGGGFSFGFSSAFPTLSAMNAAFGSGSYRFDFDTENDFFTTATLNLGGDNYPATPRISNFAAAQSVNPAVDFTLRWDALTGGTANDLVEVYLYDGQDNEVFADSGGLDGTSTSEVVFAGTLMTGQTYRGELTVWKISDVNGSDYPGAIGFAGFKKITSFSVKTAGQGGGPPSLSNPLRQANGQFQLHVAGDAGRMYKIEASTDLLSWNLVLSTNAPAGGGFDVVDTQAAGLGWRFYRTVLLP